MPLDQYLSALARRWYVIVILALTALAGTIIYQASHSLQSASATVAVLEPAVFKGSADGKAAVTFSSVAQSWTVANNVVRRLGLKTSPGNLQSRVSVTLTRQLVADPGSPLYKVTVKDHDPSLAIKEVNAVISEARKTFVALNTVQPAQLDAVLAPEEQALRNKLTKAQAAYDSFDKASATQTNADLSRLRRLLPQYEQLTNNVALAGAALNQLSSRATDALVAGNSAAAAAAQRGLAEARVNFSKAQDALARFKSDNNVDNLPAEITAKENAIQAGSAAPTAKQMLQRSSLLQNVQTAQGQLTQLETRKVDIYIASALSPSNQISVLDGARLEGSLLASLIYVLAVVVGIVLGLVLIYLFAYFDRSPHSTEEVQQLLGAPVLVRVPKSA